MHRSMASCMVVIVLTGCSVVQGLLVGVAAPSRLVASRTGRRSCNGRCDPLHASQLACATSPASEERSGRGIPQSSSPGFGSRTRRRKIGRGRERRPQDGPSSQAVVVLKRSSRWACVKGCGACCYLAPDERPDLADYLPDPQELALYISMAGEDGWCTHFDRENRACTIYDDRPRFCRVETDTFGEMYGVGAEYMDEFCTSCCNEQIGDVYGAKSKEMRVFLAAVKALERGERPIPESDPFGLGTGDHTPQIRDWSGEGGVGTLGADSEHKRRRP